MWALGKWVSYKYVGNDLAKGVYCFCGGEDCETGKKRLGGGGGVEGSVKKIK